MVADYCTGWFEGWWAQCCYLHDVAYASPAIDRLTADQDLASCVAGTGGIAAAAIGAVMFVGVRLFGGFFRRRALRRQFTSSPQPIHSPLPAGFFMSGPNMAAELFRSKAPWIMQKLMDDFPIGLDDAAAILGNLGHESGGFASMQEIRPTVAGSAGGYGWAQWTGPRRRAFEAYCERNNLDPSSDVANYKFLFVELKGSEKGAIAAVVGADGLEAKVEAFEKGFERAGIKHYPSRITWAKRAMEAYQDPSASHLAPFDRRAEPAPPVSAGAQPAPAPAVPAKPDEPRPANPSPTPVEQASKAVGAGKWTAITGAVWTAISTFLMATPAVPAIYRDPILLAGIGTLLTTVASIVGSYNAPENAKPAA